MITGKLLKTGVVIAITVPLISGFQKGMTNYVTNCWNVTNNFVESMFNGNETPDIAQFDSLIENDFTQSMSGLWNDIEDSYYKLDEGNEENFLESIEEQFATVWQ